MSSCDHMIWTDETNFNNADIISLARRGSDSLDGKRCINGYKSKRCEKLEEEFTVETHKDKSRQSDECGLIDDEQCGGIRVVVTTSDDHTTQPPGHQSPNCLSHETTTCMSNSSSDPTLHYGYTRRRHRSGGLLNDHDVSPRPRLRMPRDTVQPSTGSVSELHGTPPTSRLEDEEELDELQPLSRPRSSTCPEMKALRRKLRVKMLNRPPTPPPGDCMVMKLGSSESGSGECLEEESEETDRTMFVDEWRIRRASDCCPPDLPAIEESTFY